jgi:putative ABC transport system ATP-binding protein
MRDPPILLLDEPTAHLDDAQAHSLVGTLASLAAEARALLVATHDPRLVAADGVTRVLDLAGGRLVPRAPIDPVAETTGQTTSDNERKP